MGNFHLEFDYFYPRLQFIFGNGPHQTRLQGYYNFSDIWISCKSTIIDVTDVAIALTTYELVCEKSLKSSGETMT